MTFLFFLVLIFLFALIHADLPKLTLKQLDTGERVFVDDLGREVQLHGTNVIVKGPPWYPYRDEFNSLISLTKQDFEYMNSVGLNVIRLGMMWPGVEPVQGQYNETYLQIMKEIVEEAAEYGIYCLLDMHQDLYSEKFCGEGVPEWAMDITSYLKFPQPLERTPYQTPYPTRQECSKHSWTDYYASPAIGSAVGLLYTNDSLLDAWGGFWGKVASTFKDVNGALGYELINEPFPGNPYRDPLLMIPRLGDAHLLEAYDKLSSHIRTQDPDGLIFFAPVTWADLSKGFDHAPGGAEYADRSVLAYHYYTPPQFNDHIDSYFNANTKDAQKLKVAQFLTESCCSGFFDNAMEKCHELGISWAQWEWKDFCKETAETKSSDSQEAWWGACKTGYGAGPFHGEGSTPDPETMAKFGRPYATNVAGHFLKQSFNATTKVYNVSYQIDTSVVQGTRVFGGLQWHYPNGHIASTSGLNYSEDNDGYFTLVSNGKAQSGDTVSFELRTI